MSERPSQTIAIVGAGQAGAEVAISLRQKKFAGRIVLIGDEAQPPYKRPPLSKAFLTGAMPASQLVLAPQANLERAGIEFLTGARATQIDREARQLHLVDGRRLHYDKLVLATGGWARRLAAPGADKPNIFTLRSLGDAEALRRQLLPGRRLAVIGGGFIGLEVAASARKLGLAVIVLENQSRILAKVTAPEISAFLDQLHRNHGVEIRCAVAASAFLGESEATAVALADGSLVPADLFLIGVGLLPHVELAEEAGLEVDNGIVVDARLQTSDPLIFAVGDCANAPNSFARRRLRLESVQNAVEQGRHVAAALLGETKIYESIPWFWSDQYDVKLQMVGLIDGYDRLALRGDPDMGSFSAFFLRENRVVAVHALNRPQDFLLGKKIVAAALPLTAETLSDEKIPLAALRR